MVRDSERQDGIANFPEGSKGGGGFEGGISEEAPKIARKDAVNWSGKGKGGFLSRCSRDSRTKKKIEREMAEKGGVLAISGVQTDKKGVLGEGGF